MVMIDRVAGRIFRRSIAQLQTDIHRELYRSPWVLWQRDRPLGAWDDGSAAEGWRTLASGLGKLSENGAGGPAMPEGIVHPESPYRLRCAAADLPDDPEALIGGDDRSAPDRTHLYLSVEGDRLFAVDAIKEEGSEDRLASMYLRELFGFPMPQEGP